MSSLTETGIILKILAKIYRARDDEVFLMMMEILKFTICLYCKDIITYPTC
jgi:hypothetical protein